MLMDISISWWSFCLPNAMAPLVTMITCLFMECSSQAFPHRIKDSRVYNCCIGCILDIQWQKLSNKQRCVTKYDKHWQGVNSAFSWLLYKVKWLFKSIPVFQWIHCTFWLFHFISLSLAKVCRLTKFHLFEAIYGIKLCKSSSYTIIFYHLHGHNNKAYQSRVTCPLPDRIYLPLPVLQWRPVYPELDHIHPPAWWQHCPA